ncbi:hypothetical protein [Streptosporangium sp. V21-05]|uniref:hypothetical protein n=1 Tax=Streptosporangium sp. V21-05 TaxID=3446115 RepID=UPI003F534C39
METAAGQTSSTGRISIRAVSSGVHTLPGPFWNGCPVSSPASPVSPVSPDGAAGVMLTPSPPLLGRVSPTTAITPATATASADRARARLRRRRFLPIVTTRSPTGSGADLAALAGVRTCASSVVRTCPSGSSLLRTLGHASPGRVRASRVRSAASSAFPVST